MSCMAYITFSAQGSGFDTLFCIMLKEVYFFILSSVTCILHTVNCKQNVDRGGGGEVARPNPPPPLLSKGLGWTWCMVKDASKCTKNNSLKW